ncbi:hypothetical protein ANCDUO_12755 [Ancylostoma duodenale]|uniref:Uncharacterized protein n=1 Tax=Ancylostoma duodenale TaxID=51022 RepID=A0A0C2CKN3_9BILA|nr:hypothetical protein ANCDUO_12755 [Ancylostoma duodenale]
MAQAMVLRLCLMCLKSEDCRIKCVGSGRDHPSCCVIQNVHKPPPNARGVNLMTPARPTRLPMPRRRHPAVPPPKEKID